MTLYHKENISSLNIYNYLMKKEKKKKTAIAEAGVDRLAL